jgi:acetyl/propionyl-CoA carboxylase alpha subunit
MRILCGDLSRDVSVSVAGETVEATVGDERFRLRLQETAAGVFLLQDGNGRTETFHCVRDGETIHLFWRGVVYRLTEEKEGGRQAARQASGALEAPMPGKVIAVRVTPGQEVARGDELVVVEAMKMENALRAPRAGRVKAVAARVGEMVAPGVALVELE